MELTNELRSLVHESVALLGEVIQRELGARKYERIENIRQRMTGLRKSSQAKTLAEFHSLLKELKKLNSSEQHEIAHSFTLMLELMNVCENAYRSHRLRMHAKETLPKGEKPQAIIYVLTAHPTEARSPQNIAIFHEIQNLLIELLSETSMNQNVNLSVTQRNALFHFLEIAWRTPIVRNRSPKVKDEAEHIYSQLFRKDILASVLNANEREVPFYVRSWVGGDKDGHPGVDDRVLLESLNLSRKKIVGTLRESAKAIRRTFHLFSSQNLQSNLSKVEKNLQAVQTIRKGDAQRIQKLRQAVAEFRKLYHKTLGSIHPELLQLCQIMHTFPGLVVPLELRESSDVLMSEPKGKLAIEKMLTAIAQVSRGGDPRWYARGFIISMTESIEHIRMAAQKQKAAFGSIRLPVIPLFEEASSLADADHIMKEMVSDPELHKAAQKFWGGMVEMMVGYSDSSKEAGVFPSRLAIAKALPILEKVCQRADLTPVFFHGSGGSIDRGGGSIEDQTAWWPKSALNRYKVTVQGEMVERSLATPAIAQRQLEKIARSAMAGLHHKHDRIDNKDLDFFAAQISAAYRSTVTSEEFLSVIEAATPYSYLRVLKIGSRPSKRAAKLSVGGLRAIPWILCWTQTRVLFPTWWGVGSAWAGLSKTQKQNLKLAFRKEPVFTSYVKALGFTLAKVELPVWQMYLEQSGLEPERAQGVCSMFENEFKRTVQFYQEVCGQKDFLWYRPWLGESIQLRSPMIHPLNLLQILAQANQDVRLLRLTVTGISSGMLTTG